MRTLYSIALLIFTIGIQAQTTEKKETKTESEKASSYPDPPRKQLIPTTYNENSIYNSAGLDVQPEFPGGTNAFNEFILTNFKDPVIEDGPKTVKAYISFVIEKDGSVTDIKILRDPGYGIGDEAKRVLKLSPKWKPGIQNDKPVRCQLNLPLTLNIPAPLPSKAKG